MVRTDVRGLWLDDFRTKGPTEGGSLGFDRTCVFRGRHRHGANIAHATPPVVPLL